MHQLRASTLTVLLMLAVLAAGVRSAQAVAVSPSNGSGLAGQTVDIDINTASLTGLNVTSLQFDLSYTNTQVIAVDVIPAGSLTAAVFWQAPTFSVRNSGSTGTIRVSDAGSSPIVGAGSLLKVRFLINASLLDGGGSMLLLANFRFNEGTPPVTTTDSVLTIDVTPRIFISPSSGEIVRGQTLQFSVSGAPTIPVGYTTSNAAVATISAAGLLTGISPGAVTVTATDAAARSSTTSGQVLVHGMGITAGSESVVAGNPISVPITVTSLNGLGIRSGQFELAYTRTYLTLSSVTTPAGTLLNGWGAMAYSEKATGCIVDLFGNTDLAGSGVLCYLNFSTVATSPGSTSLAFTNVVFNETLSALPAAGSITVNAVPTTGVNPSVQTLLAGQTQQYTLTNSPTPPITWSVLNPAIASIDSTGLVTALSGGVTQIRAQDAVGAVGTSTSLTVFDFEATLGIAAGPPGSTARVYLTSDRLVGGLGIHSMQFKVTWSGTDITNARTATFGLWNAWGPDGIQYDFSPNALTVASAGSTNLLDTGSILGLLQFDIAPGAPLDTDIPLTLSDLVFNEGHPVAQVVDGVLHVSATGGLPDPEPPTVFALGRIEPNPAREGTRIPFMLPASASGGEQVRLAIYGLDGRRVRSLVNAPLGAGTHEARWDGRDDAGRPVRAGIYFTRLEWQGRTASRKLTLVR